MPSQGNVLGAKAKGSLPGPYNIRAGVNDTLILSVNSNPDQTLVVPSGFQTSAKQIVDSLNSQTRNVVFSLTKKGQVMATTRTLGRTAKLIFRATSTLAQTLGLVTGRYYTGQQIMPRWFLVNDPNTLEDRPTRLIVFEEKILGTNDFFEINYTTIRQECRRCGGTGVENDWRYDSSGEVIEVRDTDLLMQEVTKIVYTERGSNPFMGWYGTRIVESVGQKMSDRGLIQNMILSDLRDAFRRWQDIKSQQEALGETVTDEEYPFQLLVANITPDATDPTVIYVNAVIQSRSSKPIQISRGLKLPIPYDLLGSSVQDTLLRAEQAKALGYYR